MNKMGWENPQGRVYHKERKLSREMKKKLRKDKNKMIHDDEKVSPGKRKFVVEDYGITIIYNTDVWDNIELKKLIKNKLAEGVNLSEYFEREIREELIVIEKGD